MSDAFEDEEKLIAAARDILRDSAVLLEHEPQGSPWRQFVDNLRRVVADYDSDMPAEIDFAGGVRGKYLKKRDEKDAISRAARQLGRKGGKKGGKARAKALTFLERKEIARNAAMVRWHGKDHGKKL